MRKGSISLFQLNTLVILLQNLVVRRPVHGHTISSDLAHTDSMAPASAKKCHAKNLALRVAFDVERKQAVTQAQQRAQTKRAHSGAPVRARYLRADRTL